MKKSLLTIVAIGLITTACSDKDGGNSAGVQVGKSELKTLESELSEVFKARFVTTTLNEKNCTETTTRNEYDLDSDTGLDISFTEALSKNGNCNLSNDTRVEVSDKAPEAICIKSAVKNGDVTEIKQCEDDGSTLKYNSKEKTATITISNSEASMSFTLKSISYNKEELEKKLKNVNIVYFETDEESGDLSTSKTEIGNAIEILKLKL